MKDLKELFPYQNINTRCIYYDKKFDPKGIDYEKFLKIRNDIEYFSPNEWYLLWYLLINSFKSNYYIKLNISLIIEETHFNIKQVKKCLTSLIDEKLIISNKIINECNKSEVIEFIIGYNSNEYYPFNIIQYEPIPVDIANIIFPTLTPNEWIIYCKLILKYNYKQKYSFPTIEQLKEELNLSDKTISKAIASLKQHKYKLIEVLVNKHNDGIFSNNRYKVKLLERIEYIYYHKKKYKGQNELLKNYPSTITENNIEWYQNNKKYLTIK